MTLRQGLFSRSRVIAQPRLRGKGGKEMAKIIVVDDDYSTSRLVKMLLEMEGYAVVTCSEGRAALAEAETGVHAFVIDCYLSGNESGIKLLETIRQEETHVPGNIPVILVSGDQRLEDEAWSAGADAFIVKPYSPNVLTDEVQRLLQKYEEKRS